MKKAETVETLATIEEVVTAAPQKLSSETQNLRLSLMWWMDLNTFLKEVLPSH
ncbi:hypothetical protein [Enterococcus raffinosus]|uniref:hypothetical protein n=1 Tax=Enterococcus raffinosus TaxID=71452 RepID=UPI000AE34F9E|nr:hypothetical protein [Enterococcus raffinosus]